MNKNSSPNDKTSGNKQVTLTTGSESYVKYFYWGIFAVCAFLSIKYCLVGINNYILDIHGFRQTQTALTAFYVIQDGFKLAYETPVLGTPWTIPFEFPLYQWIVAIMKMNSSMSLDLSGRVVSLLFFYLCLIPTYKISRKYITDKYAPLLILSFILIHPIYIFWSRTFMIESTALFFSLCYLWQALDYLENKKKIHFVLATLLGVTAALVKITTLVPFVMFLGIIILMQWIKEKGYTFNIKNNIKYVFYAVFFFLLPVITIKYWVDFSDALKQLNQYAYDCTSATKLADWNYGTMDQKLSLETWKGILVNSSLYNAKFYLFIIALIILTYYLKLKYWKHTLACLALYFSAPLIFTNLHFIHNYYTYSNSVFLCVAFGFIALSLIEQQSKQVLTFVGIGFSIVVSVYIFKSYLKDYYTPQKTNTDYIVKLSEQVKNLTKKDEVILVYGNDWGSEYAYYTERKTIALKNIFKSVNDSTFQYILKKNKDCKIRTLVFVSYFNLYDGPFLNEMVNYLGYKPVLEQQPFYIFQKPETETK